MEQSGKVCFIMDSVTAEHGIDSFLCGRLRRHVALDLGVRRLGDP
jgi:hypothetical protein